PRGTAGQPLRPPPAPVAPGAGQPDRSHAGNRHPCSGAASGGRADPGLSAADHHRGLGASGRGRPRAGSTACGTSFWPEAPTENASTVKQLTEEQPAKYETENRLEPSESLRSQESFMPAPSRGERNPFPRGTRCPPGEFARLAQRLRQRRQRRFFLRAAV